MSQYARNHPDEPVRHDWTAGAMKAPPLCPPPRPPKPLPCPFCNGEAKLESREVHETTPAPRRKLYWYVCNTAGCMVGLSNGCWTEQEALLMWNRRADNAALYYAQKLAEGLARRFYPETPQFKVFDDLFAVLTQIDNMCAGLERNLAEVGHCSPKRVQPMPTIAKDPNQAGSSCPPSNPEQKYFDGIPLKLTEPIPPMTQERKAELERTYGIVIKPPKDAAGEQTGGSQTVADPFLELVRQRQLSVDSLTQKQLADALRQAIACGDFVRNLATDGRQSVTYIPWRELERLKERYEELLYAVTFKHEGESRHETALRYIRERENRENQAMRGGQP